jgi:hypothetical protein
MSNTNTAAAQLAQALIALLPEEQIQALLGTTTVAPATKPATKPACTGRVFEVVDGEVTERGCKRNATTGTTCASHEGQDVAAAKAKAEQSAGFVSWLHDTAEVRAERKAANKAKAPAKATSAKAGDSPNKVLANAMRAEGLVPTGTAWSNAKGLVANGTSPEAAAKIVAKLAKK